jgi:hypothetical protein
VGSAPADHPAFTEALMLTVELPRSRGQHPCAAIFSIFSLMNLISSSIGLSWSIAERRRQGL